MKKNLTIVLLGILFLFGFSQCNKDNDETNEVDPVAVEHTDKVMEYIDDNIQEQLDNMADKEVPEVMQSLATWISGMDGVTHVAAYNDSIVITYEDESDAVLSVYDMTLVDENEYDFSHLFPRNMASAKQENVTIGNHKVFIYDAYALKEDLREGDSIEKIFSYYVDPSQITHLKDEQCTVEALRDLTQYGYVLLATHGSRRSFATRERVTAENRNRYLNDRLNGKLRVHYTVYKIVDGYEFEDRFYWVTSKFVRNLEGQFNNAVVFNSSCEGMKGDTPIKKAFIEKGAATVFGFDNNVESVYKYYASASIAEALLRNYSTGEAFNLFSINYSVSSYGTGFKMDGREDVTWYDIPPVPTDGLVAYFPFNGSPDDASGHGNNGILSGNNVPTLTTDRKGHDNSAYEFGGYYNPNWIRVPNSESLMFDKEYTISFWIQQSEFAGMDGWGSYSTTGPGFAPFCKAGDGFSCFPGLYFITGIGENGFGIGISTNNSNGSAHYQSNWNHNISTTHRYELGEWLHIALVVENTNKVLCVNGVDVAWDELGKEADCSSMNQQDIYIGVMAGSNPNFGWGGGFWYPFYGKIDDIRVYNRALNPFEVKALYLE